MNGSPAPSEQGTPRAEAGLTRNLSATSLGGYSSGGDGGLWGAYRCAAQSSTLSPVGMLPSAGAPSLSCWLQVGLALLVLCHVAQGVLQSV